MTANPTTPEASSTVALTGLCNFGLEQAIELQKTSLAALVSFSSYAIDLSKSASLFSPVAFSPLPGDFFDVATKAYASFLDLQMQWITLLAPRAGKATAGGNGKHQAPAKPMEHGMDAVIGSLESRVSNS